MRYVAQRGYSVFLAGALVLALSGTAFATTWNVTASGFSFSPATLTVAPGDTIHWSGSGSHTVTSGTPCTADGIYFDSPLDLTHPTFDFVVPTGVPVIHYFCRIHCAFGMTGVINIHSADITPYQITMDGDQEVPAVNTPGSGSGTATLDNQTNQLSWNITFSGLTSPQTNAHFHASAAQCGNAGVAIPLPLGSPIVGSAALTAAQVADLKLGHWYVNVHTQNNPNGEIRGWVLPAPLADPLPPIIKGDAFIRLVPVVTGITAPVWGSPAPGQPGRLYVTEQSGMLWSVNLANGNKTAFLDVSARLVPLGIGGPNTYDERGFLGTAFDPNYATNGLLYTYTSEPVSGPADFSTLPVGAIPNCQSVLAEWHVPNPADPNSVVDPNSRREVLRVDKPQFNHNGGGLNFGPDGFLYLSLGDGGSADDHDEPFPLAPATPTLGHGCLGNGQNTNVILGKIIRIDPHGNNSANGKYGVPADNPFVGGGGLGEIWAYGLRNPWRYSFDMANGSLYCADVGQNDVEEINIITRGGNYGWRYKEGSFFFVVNGGQNAYVTNQPLDVPAGLIDPIAEYDHDDGIATIGGFVYRGTSIPALSGKYIFGDLAKTFNNDGRLFYLDTGNVIKEFNIAGQPNLGHFLLGWGQDANGEVYVMANSTGVPFGSTGVVLRVASDKGDMNCDGVINFADINPFVLALTGQAAYQAAFPNCNYLNADVNGDSSVNFGDINPFVALLSAP